jgi:hypothetical protein
MAQGTSFIEPGDDGGGARLRRHPMERIGYFLPAS